MPRTVSNSPPPFINGTIESIFATGLHEYLDGVQAKLIELDIAFNRTYCAY